MQLFRITKLCLILAAIVLAAGCTQVAQRVEGAPAGSGGPRYAVDATWPKPLPNN